jgi:hypothetical protein
MILRSLLALLFLSGPFLSAQSDSPQSMMLKAARGFLTTLTPAQRSKATFPFNSEERFRWFYTPVSRHGIPLKDMNASQKRAALNLLHVGLSEKGYTKAETIRRLEDILREMEGNPGRDPDLYYFTFFGEPSENGPWGWRYEGHHCSQNWTIVNGKPISGSVNSPQFFGANPAEGRSGPMKGTRILGTVEDFGWALVRSFAADQRKDGVLSATAPGEILTSNDRKAAIQENRGIAYSELTKDQQGTLLALIEEYLSTQPHAMARARLDKIRAAGLDTIKFAWMGGINAGEGHYYRVQGSTFLIEFDNTQNSANHIHCVWREFQ